MWSRLKDIGFGLLPVVLFSLYALLALYAFNIDGMDSRQIWSPLFLTLLLVIGGFLIVYGLLRNVHLSSLLSTVAVASFFSYGHIKVLFESILSDSQAAIATVVVYAIVYALLGWLLLTKRMGWVDKKSIQILSIVGAVLVSTTLIQIIPVELHRQQVRQTAKSAVQSLPQPANSEEQSTATSSQLPDIYYIVLDRYAASKTQSEIYDHDNSQFDQALTEAGFYVADQSRANYPKTLFSLPSALNLDYLQNIIDVNDPDNSDADTAAVLFSNHRLGRIMKELGYTYYHIGNSYELTRSVEVADANILPDNSDFVSYSTYTKSLLGTTFYPTIALRLWPQWHPATSMKQHVLWNDFQMTKVRESVDWSGPKFVMAHLLLPHDPFVYDAQCQPLNTPLQRWESQISTYLDQVGCANKFALEAIQTILDNAEQPPIIVLQADEGPEAMVDRTGHHWKFEGATDKAIDERTQILNAYYFPDGDYSQLYPDITPVNTFRTILRQYFGFSDLTNLEDTTYLWPDKDNLFNFYPYKQP